MSKEDEEFEAAVLVTQEDMAILRALKDSGKCDKAEVEVLGNILEHMDHDLDNFLNADWMDED